MIRRSSNKAATSILNQVGIENLAEILQSEKYRLYDPEHNGGLWVGRDYSGSPVWKRDPLHNISHGATAMQVARFYYLAVTGRLVAKQHAADFKLNLLRLSKLVYHRNPVFIIIWYYLTSLKSALEYRFILIYPMHP